MKACSFLRSKWFPPAAAAVLALTAGLVLGRLRPAETAVAARMPASDAGRPPATLIDYGTGGSTASEGLQTLQNMQNAFRAVAAKVLPTVVEIDVVDVVKQSTPALPGPFDFFPREFRRQGLGSGVIVRRTADKVHVLTNNLSLIHI